MRNSTLEYCFGRAAKDDWFGATSIISEIGSKPLKLRARLAACAAVLEGGPGPGPENKETSKPRSIRAAEPADLREQKLQFDPSRSA
jgi:hypothetical protein